MQHRYEFVRGKKHITNKCIVFAQDRLRFIVIEGKEIVYMKNTCKLIRIEYYFPLQQEIFFS